MTVKIVNLVAIVTEAFRYQSWSFSIFATRPLAIIKKKTEKTNQRIFGKKYKKGENNVYKKIEEIFKKEEFILKIIKERRKVKVY